MAAKRTATDGPQKKRDRIPAQKVQLKKQRTRQAKEGPAGSKARAGHATITADGGPGKPTRKEADIDSASQDSVQLSVLVAYQKCRAVRWRPRPVVAISVCPDQSTVAVARDNGTIELWNTSTWNLILVCLTARLFAVCGRQKRDTYSNCICCADCPGQARGIHYGYVLG